MEEIRKDNAYKIEKEYIAQAHKDCEEAYKEAKKFLEEINPENYEDLIKTDDRIKKYFLTKLKLLKIEGSPKYFEEIRSNVTKTIRIINEETNYLKSLIEKKENKQSEKDEQLRITNLSFV